MSGSVASAAAHPHSWRASVARILPLAWPVVVGQVAVLGFGTIDTVLVAHHSAVDLAALAVGASSYVTVYVALMGLLLAIGPLAGQLYGARREAEAGVQLQQAVWLALALSALGCALLLFPQPFLAMARATPEVADKVRAYMAALAGSLPAALLFTVYRGFNTAVSRPKAVMALQLSGLALKLPLSLLLVRQGGLGVAGCGVATAIVMWCQLLGAAVVLRRDPFYRRFQIWGRRWPGPQRAPLAAQLRLGLPMGTALLIEVTGFTFMAIFISRLSPLAVAGHQIAANLVALLYMLPLGLANATSALVAQRIGAGDLADARRLGWHGVQLAGALAALLGSAVFLLRAQIARLYAGDPAIIAAAMPLLAWVALFHLGDALQCMTAFVLRAWHVATAPVVVYALALWGVGLGGGYWLAFGPQLPAAHGARGFWIAASLSLLVAAASLLTLLRWVLTQRAVDAGVSA